MTDKCPNLMHLKLKLAKKKLNENAVQLVEHKVPVTSAVEFMNILEQDWQSLSIENQKELFVKFLGAMGKFKTIDEE